MRDERPVVFTVSSIDGASCRLYTKDGRIAEKDREVTNVKYNKLLDTMVMVSEVLNNEGYAVTFEVD